MKTLDEKYEQFLETEIEELEMYWSESGAADESDADWDEFVSDEFAKWVNKQYVQ